MASGRRLPGAAALLPPLLVSALLVSACGGGAAGPPRPPEPPRTAPVCTPPDAIPTADFGCLSAQSWRRERQTLAARHGGRAEFKNQWGLAAIRADRAYAQLELAHGTGVEPGGGQTAGLIDDGLDTGHPAFARKTVSEHILDGTGAAGGRISSHGTMVASVIAGRPTAAHTARGAAHGVAPGADLALLAVRLGQGGGPYVPISLDSLSSDEDRLAQAFTRAANWSHDGRKIDFVNASWGYSGIIDQYDEQGLRGSLGGTIAALAQTGAPDKTVFVFAAGNAHDKPCDPADFPGNSGLCLGGRVNARSVQIQPGLPARIAELRGHVLAVVAVAPDSDGGGDYEITPFSNRCGIAARWCIAAPGEAVKAAYFGPDPTHGLPGTRGVATGSGTSFAAPFVTGGLMVMKQLFRGQMTNTELAARLLATANKQGIYADSRVYGQGLMDLGAATAPVGVTTVTLGGRIDSPGNHVARTRFTPGGALGNGLAQAFSGGGEIVAFDTLGAPFWFPLGGLVSGASGPALTARLRSFMAPPRTGQPGGILRPGAIPLTARAGDAEPLPFRLGLLGAAPFGAGGGHLSLAGPALTVGVPRWHGFGFAAFSTEGMRGRTPASGAALTWRPPEQPFILVGGMVGERRTLLGSKVSGAFGRLAGQSAFAGLEGEFRAGAWRLAAGAEIGTVKTAVSGGMLASVSPLTTSAFVLRAERALGGRDALAVSVGRPLRVEAGRARLSIPVGRTKDGRVVRRSMTADLEPTGWQIDIAAQWRHSLDNGGELRLGAGWSRHPGHDAAAGPEWSILAGWRRTF